MCWPGGFSPRKSRAVNDAAARLVLQDAPAEDSDGGGEGEPMRVCRLNLLMYRKDRRSRAGRRREPAGAPALELSALNEEALESIQVRAVMRAVLRAVSGCAKWLRTRPRVWGSGWGAAACCCPRGA